MSNGEISNSTIIRGVSLQMVIMLVGGIISITGTYYSLAGEQDKLELEQDKQAMQINAMMLEQRSIKNLTFETDKNVAVMLNEQANIKNGVIEILKRLDRQRLGR